MCLSVQELSHFGQWPAWRLNFSDQIPSNVGRGIYKCGCWPSTKLQSCATLALRTESQDVESAGY